MQDTGRPIERRGSSANPSSDCTSRHDARRAVRRAGSLEVFRAAEATKSGVCDSAGALRAFDGGALALGATAPLFLLGGSQPTDGADAPPELVGVGRVSDEKIRVAVVWIGSNGPAFTVTEHVLHQKPAKIV